MSETKFIVFTIIYALIAAIFTFKVAPDMLKASYEIDGSIIEFNRVSELEVKLRKQHEGNSYKLGDKVYDTIPFKIAFDTIRRKYKYINVFLKIDTLLLDFSFDIQKKSSHMRNFLDAMDKAKLLNKKNYIEQLPRVYKEEDLKAISNVKIVLEKKRDFSNKNNYVAINSKKVQGYNINLRKKASLTISYLVWILSSISLVIIPFGAYVQLKNYNKNGIQPYLPNRWDSVKDFFNLFSRNKN